MKKLLHILTIYKLLAITLLANAPSGTVMGTIIDRDTQQPLPGANVILDLRYL